MRPALPDGGWRVVERLGEARYQTAADGGWSPAMPASTLADGSRIATGAGGRLILARPGQHVSAGPASRFTLPGAAPGAPLEQHAGWLRYRVADGDGGRLLVATPFLEIEVASTVFDVTVSTTATEVSVEQGEVRIATPDGRREIELGAGESAYAGGARGAALAFRRTAAGPLEPVEAIVLPAIHARPEVREGRSAPLIRRADYAGSRASSSGAAASRAVVPIGKAEIAAGAAARPPVERSAPGLGHTPPPSAAARPLPARQEAGEPPTEEPPPTAFDRLSEGIVDGLPGAPHPPQPPHDARRSF